MTGPQYVSHEIRDGFWRRFRDWLVPGSKRTLKLRTKHKEWPVNPPYDGSERRRRYWKRVTEV